jgi:NADH:ubiquinone oxidoreductase, NADH-binding (51 kD) subunit
MKKLMEQYNVDMIIKKYCTNPDNLLQMLIEIQNSSEKNYISEDNIHLLSIRLGIPESRIYSIITFYSMLSVRPRGRNIIRVCKSGPCHISGQNAIINGLENLLGIKVGETTCDGLFSIEYSSCFGGCDVSPAIKIGSRIYGNLDIGRLEKIIESYREKDFDSFPKILTSNIGKIAPYSLDDYIKNGGFKALSKALRKPAQELIEEIKISNLKGRGGAAFPTWKKLDAIFHEKSQVKYIVCNGDEGEPGTFKDRLLLNGDPFKIIEGMAISAYIIGSTQGYIYIRGEYSDSKSLMEYVVDQAMQRGYIGENILGSGFGFKINIVSGAGAYVCGEDTALVESIEGKAGKPRVKPPHLKDEGLFGFPTIVNNIETFSCIPFIVLNGGSNFKNIGTHDSSGTKLVCLSGDVNNRGVFEVPFGITLRDIIFGPGGGIRNNRNIKFIQMGGASGACFNDTLLHMPLDYKILGENGISIGSGAILVADDSNCIIDLLKCITEFFIHECCGKCTPCREGNMQIMTILDKLKGGSAEEEDINLLMKTSDVMTKSAFCGLGRSASSAVTSSMRYFIKEIMEHIDHKCSAGVCSFSR